MKTKNANPGKPIRTAFEKRLKRQVGGRVRDYFAVTAPGLEAICAGELQGLSLSVQDVRTDTGGVHFKGRLSDCYIANLHLRSAGRVLMRIDSFKSTAFRQLDRHLSRIPWELFLVPGATPEVKVSTRHCRLHHSDAVTAAVRGGILQRFAGADTGHAPADEQVAAQQVFIRGDDDRFTVSLDSSGDNLYKRGVKQQGGTAPIRETLAAAVLKTAGYSAGEPLIDPMCGTGTFSLEAAMLNMNIPAGWFRTFAFTAWPSFQAKRWDFIRRECQGRFVTVPEPVVFASDRSETVCDKLSSVVHSFGFSTVIAVAGSDFFSFSPGDITDKPGLVVINPPYGRRLGGLKDAGILLDRVARHFKSAYGGWKFAVIVPREQTVPDRLKPYRLTRLRHGGLAMKLLTGRIKM